MSLMPEKSGRIRRYIASVLLSAGVLLSGFFSSGITKAQTGPSAQKNDVTQTDYPDYPGRQYPDFNVSTYTTVDQDSLQVPPDLMPLWQNMQVMKNSNTIIGPALARLSSEANIWFCYAEHSRSDDQWSPETYLKTLPKNTAAVIRDCLAALQENDGPAEQNGGGPAENNSTATTTIIGWWQDQDGVVYLSKSTTDESAAYTPLVQGHELTHAIQNIRGSSHDDIRWFSIRDFQACTLSFEAAAYAIEYLLGWELVKDSVQTNSWEEACRRDSLKCSVITKAFNEATAKGVPYAQALEQAGKSTFYYQFTQDWWLETFNDQLLTNYIRNVVEDRLAFPFEDRRYDLNTVRETGYISPEFNATARVDSLPSDLFGGFEEMRQAFDYADLDRYLRAGGRDSELYQRKLAEAQKDNNPYLGVDMELVYKTLEASNYSLMAIAVMDYYADQLYLQPAPEYKNLATPQR